MIYLALVLIPVIWLWQNVQHEGCHALMAKYFGATIEKFYPFPVWDDDILPRVWAYMQYSMPKDAAPLTNTQRALIYIAPQIANTVLLWIFVLAFSFTGWVGLVPFMLTNYIDGAFNISTLYRSKERMNEDFLSDGWGFAKYTGWNVTSLRICAVIWHIGFLMLVGLILISVL